VVAILPASAATPVSRRRPDADGLTVDAEGGVWVALADGGQVRRYARGRAGRGGRAAGDEGHHLRIRRLWFDQLFITTS
jgi:sugar lactone lactonase YvrE